MAEDHSPIDREQQSFAPIVYAAILAALLASGAMAWLVHHRTDVAFATPTEYPGTFLNRDFFADYSRDPDSPGLVAAALDEATGDIRVALVDVVPGFRPLREELIAVALD